MLDINEDKKEFTPKDLTILKANGFRGEIDNKESEFQRRIVAESIFGRIYLVVKLLRNVFEGSTFINFQIHFALSGHDRDTQIQIVQRYRENRLDEKINNAFLKFINSIKRDFPPPTCQATFTACAVPYMEQNFSDLADYDIDIKKPSGVSSDRLFQEISENAAANTAKYSSVFYAEMTKVIFAYDRSFRPQYSGAPMLKVKPKTLKLAR